MKKQLFYVFEEHTDFVKECIKLGMKPIKGDQFVELFDFNGVLYKTLSVNECYSGWEINVMALPYMNYSQLINVLENTKIYSEIVGCIGILLKEHLDEFMKYLSESSNRDKRIRKIKKIIVKEISDRSSRVAEMYDLIKLCSH